MKQILTSLCLIFAVLLFSAGVSWSDETNIGPSFDCDKASTLTEYAICASDDLSALDRVLADAYKVARGLDNSTTLRDEQRQWNKERSSTCGDDVECLSRMYHERIKVLCGDDVECISSAETSTDKGNQIKQAPKEKNLERNEDGLINLKWEKEYLPCQELARNVHNSFSSSSHKSSRYIKLFGSNIALCDGEEFPKKWIEKTIPINKYALTNCNNCNIRQFPIYGSIFGTEVGSIGYNEKLFILNKIITIPEIQGAQQPWYRHWYSFSYQGKTLYIYADSIENIGLVDGDDIAISSNSADYYAGDKIFLNACGGNPEAYKNHPLNINEKIVEVPNIITEVKTSPYGRPIIVEATSTMNLGGRTAITAKLKNFRILSIIGEKGKVLYERRVSGATSIYELKHHGKIVGWGVGWHKSCKKYYSHADFTVLRALIPIKNHDYTIDIKDQVLGGVVQSEFSKATNNSSGFILIGGSDIYKYGYNSCYYCMPRFYLIDNTYGIIELSDLTSLKSVGINVNNLDPLLYATWLSYQGEKTALGEFVSKNFDKILPSALRYTEIFATEIYDESIIRGRKNDCLEFIRTGYSSIQEIGVHCFPELENLAYFRTK